MCIIAVSKRGVKQPTYDHFRTMFDHNPDGAGYMYARNGRVIIHKGFMAFEDFYRSVKEEQFTTEDAVVYHFRISTQAGVNPQMTHPFPLTVNKEDCERLDLSCSVGIAHNGIIRLTSNIKEKRYSDTVLFITDYMTKLVRKQGDIDNLAVQTMIANLTNSKWALLDGYTEDIVTIGKFENVNGLLFSNGTYNKAYKTTIIPPKKFNWDDYRDGYYGVYTSINGRG